MHARPAVRCPAKLVGTPMQTRKIKKWSNGHMNSGSRKGPSLQRILAESAMARGWLDGKPYKKGAQA